MMDRPGIWDGQPTILRDAWRCNWRAFLAALCYSHAPGFTNPRKHALPSIHSLLAPSPFPPRTRAPIYWKPENQRITRAEGAPSCRHCKSLAFCTHYTSKHTCLTRLGRDGPGTVKAMLGKRKMTPAPGLKGNDSSHHFAAEMRSS